MRKVLILALAVAIALGGIGFAHAAVTESQDDLLIYPTLQEGDKSVLDGMSASMTFNCGDHLLWYSSYEFGGETETEFVYDREGIGQEQDLRSYEMEVYLSGATAASTTGSFPVGAGGYGALLQAVAAQTEKGSEKTMELRLADYLEYYPLEFSLNYQEYDRYCHLSVGIMDLLEERDWYGCEWFYEDFMELFRFPVQEDQTASVTVFKNDAGQISSFDFCPWEAPELYFASHVGSEGIWFVPVFRDSEGNPLSYESPEGHGLYFVPWKVTESYTDRTCVIPDLEQLRLVIPLDGMLPIDHIAIDGEGGECRLLSHEDGWYFLSVWDLTTGREKSRLELMRHDPDQNSYGEFVQDSGFLLVTAQGKLALVDPQGWQLLLTAPDIRDRQYSAASYTPAEGGLRFDGQRLYLLSPGRYYRDCAFWTAVWQQGELVYYGEYDCSLLRGNDAYYYRAIEADTFPMSWK